MSLLFKLCSAVALLAIAASCVRPPAATRTSVGLADGTNRHFSHTIDVAAPPSRIWALWMDARSWPTWDPELREVSAESALAIGVRGRLVPIRGKPARFRVTELTDGERYVFETQLPAATLRITRTVTATPGGSRFTHDVQFAGPLGGIFAAKFGPAFRRALPVAMARLAALAVPQ